MFMPMHVYVCMYVCMYVVIYMYIFMYAWIHAKSAKFGYFCLASREGSGTCLARALKTH